MRNLVILAGGKSSRMGRDKVLLKIDGKAFIEHLYEKAAASFDRIIISTDTGEHAQTIKSLPAFVTAAGSFRAPEFVTDIYAEKGPMGGIVSVFEATDADKFAIISVDVPHADMQVLAYLFDHCEKSACFLRFEGRKRESLIAAYSRRAYPALKASLEAGGYKLRMALKPEEVDVFDAAELTAALNGTGEADMQEAFTNFNTPADLENL